jgi:uncharacterized protein YggE
MLTIFKVKNLFFIILFLLSDLAISEVRLISVEGVVEKSFKPTIISFNLNIWGKANTAKEAQKFQAEESMRVKKILKEFEIKEKDTMTTAYELNPNYVYDQHSGQRNINGYQATETVTIILRKIEEGGKFIDEISSVKPKGVGVNINNINWDIENREIVQKELLTDAVDVALKKAELLAIASHVKIKNVHHLVPGNGNVFSPPISNLKSFNGGALSESMPQTSIQSGQVKVLSTVNIDYEIE